MMPSMRLSQALLALATLAFVVAPALTPPFVGYKPGLFPVEIIRPAIQPAGYAFSIWAVIYLWLLAHAGFGLMARRSDLVWARTEAPLAGAAALGSVWLAIANAAPITATIAIVIMASLAISAYLRADPVQDKWLLAAPLAIFAGWLTAASAVSLGVVLAGYGWLNNTNAALLTLAMVLATALRVQSLRPNMPVYGATVVWACAGIAVANWGQIPLVAYSAIAGAVLLAAATLIMARR